MLGVSDAATQFKPEECFAEIANPCKRRQTTHRHDATTGALCLLCYLLVVLSENMGVMFEV